MSRGGSSESPFKLTFPPDHPLGKRSLAVLRALVEKISGLEGLQKLYSDMGLNGDERNCVRCILDHMGIRVEVSEEDLKRIPKAGPILVVANHPFGAIEGVILAQVLLSARSDVKILANYLLGRIPELRNLFFFVDPFEAGGRKAANVRATREAVLWMKDGGLLGIFPSGEVSHIRWSRWNVQDPEWDRSVARMVRMTKASVLPVYFPGSNTKMFQLAGLVHPRMRTAMLPRQLLNKKEKRIQVRIGAPVPFPAAEAKATDEELTDYLRFRTYALGNRGRPAGPPKKRTRKGAPIPAGKGSDVLAEEVRGLPAEAKLSESHENSVYFFPGGRAPELLREIGRLRELTFRQEEEGSGKPLDLDPFDDYYLHLFVWNEKEREIVGAYRMGPTDDVLNRYGVAGFYTNTLFKYGKELIERVSPGLELGRSFVQPKYQKSFWSLMFLWKGIGQFIGRHPRYRYLFGPVSVSSGYSGFSRRLIAGFLKANHLDRELAPLVKAKNPPRHKTLKCAVKGDPVRLIRNMDELSDLIADVETKFQGVPVLLKHYLNLGGRILSFHVDRDFNDSLDAFILVDLAGTGVKTLARFMGEAGYGRFAECHGLPPP